MAQNNQESGLCKIAEKKTQISPERARFLEALRRAARTMPEALAGLFLAACATSGPKGAKPPKSGGENYDFVLGTPPANMDNVRAGIRSRLEHDQEISIKAEPGLQVEGFDRAGISSADIRDLIGALPGNCFASVRYATTYDNRPNVNVMGRLTLVSVDRTIQNGRPQLVVYGPECFGNSAQAYDTFVNYLGQEVGRAYAFANLPSELSGTAHRANPLDALMARHRGPDMDYASGPVFDEPILNGFQPPGLTGQQLFVRQQQVYWVSLVNAALHVKFQSPKQDWRQAFMTQLVTTYRALADRAVMAAGLMAGFFAAKDKNADPNRFIRDFQAHEKIIKMTLGNRDVYAAMVGAVKDPGLRLLAIRTWQAGPDERASYLDFSPHVEHPQSYEDTAAPDQRTPYMREADVKIKKAEAAIREKAAKDPNIEIVVTAALDFSHELSELRRQMTNDYNYSRVLGTRLTQAASKLDTFYLALSPQDKEKAMPLIIQSLRAIYYGDPIKQ